MKMSFPQIHSEEPIRNLLQPPLLNCVIGSLILHHVMQKEEPEVFLFVQTLVQEIPLRAIYPLQEMVTGYQKRGSRFHNLAETQIT